MAGHNTKNEMKKVSLIITFILALSLLVNIECRGDDGKAYLERGLKAYKKDADLDRTISELQEAIQLGLNDNADLIQAHLYLGFAYIGKGQRIHAIVEFAKAINLDSTLSLDPKLYSSKIVTVFNETKESLVDSLTVISVPGGAGVYLDGKYRGVTPLRLGDVLASEHTLTVVKEFFQPKTTDIRVGKGEDNRVQVQLDKAEVELRITSQPLESAVYVSGKLEGKTPLSLRIVLDQELNVKLAKEEFSDRALRMKLTTAGVTVYGIENVFPIKDGVGHIHIELSPAPIPGSLQVSSDPSGAEVYLDGILIGKTPLALARVTPGSRELRVTITDFDNVTEKIDVISDKKTKVEIPLGGRINVLSVPTGAQVFVDEKYAGVAPIVTEKISTGSHQLRLTMERYKDRRITVVLERGQEKGVDIRLLPRKGSIAVSSDPSEADVYLDGEIKGKTPLFIYGVMIGQHSIRLTKTDHKDWEKKINIEEYKISWCFGKLD